MSLHVRNSLLNITATSKLEKAQEARPAQFYPECGDSGHELEQRCETSEAGECKVGHNRGVGNIEGLKVAEGDMGKFCIQMQHTRALAQYLQEDFDILECFESKCLNLHPRKQHVEAAVRNVSLTLWRMEKSLSPALTSAGEDRAISPPSIMVTEAGVN
ncbi:hypothetical protein B0H14DRAFT_2600736 [Mycena olivaceomarginata]|nr:hypothetical protein B0H14DRAFT_2600736 [Mycena olivaceomarginata]